jgi:uncharacterized membrane protein YphA (DoxX/SURF4 family)
MFGWYRIFLERAVKEHIDLFALLVTVAELALGVMLILGLLIRVVSVIGILLVVNYLLATWHIGFPYTTLNAVFVVSLLIFGVVSAGRCLGIDSLLHDRFPEIPIF